MVSVTRYVKFIRKGIRGNSLIMAITDLRKYTLAQWQSYGAVNKQNNWINISNAADMKVGDTIVINGVVTDKENISISLYATIVAITGTTVIANSTTIIMAGERGIQGIQGLQGIPGTPGEKGDRGPALRGPQDFFSLPTGYQFYQGADGDPYVDIVYYNGNYYKCVWTHKKEAGETSDSNLTAKYWVLSDKVEMIATKVLLASYALVKNLGVEAIEMKDGSGNIVFKAKDGSVICKSGTFEDVTVTGNITANLMKHRISTSNSDINGMVVVADGNYTALPELKDGECMSIKIYAPLITRSSPVAKVSPKSSKVLIFVAGTDIVASSSYKTLGYGVYDLLGVGKSAVTVWTIK